MKTESAANRDRILLFFILCLFAWVIWGMQLAHRQGWLAWAPSLSSPLNALTVWSPGLAAILLSALAAGKKGVSGLLRPLLALRVPAVLIAFALLFEPIKWAAACGIDLLLGHQVVLGDVPLLRHFGVKAAYMIPVALLFVLPNAIGEEIGWRGYALPRLQKKYTPMVATVVIGLFWGVWHLPMWIHLAKDSPSLLSLLAMVLNMVPTATLFTWLYNRTNGSLFLPCLFHASIAAKGYMFPNLHSLTETILLWLVAVFIAICFGLGPKRLLSSKAQSGEYSSKQGDKNA